MRFVRLSSLLLLCLNVNISFCYEDKSIYRYLVENGYSEFGRLVRQAKLDSTLDLYGPYTVLIPTNDAINNLATDLAAALGESTTLLKNIVEYHVIDGFTLMPEFKTGKDEMTLNGQAINVTKINNAVTLNNSSRILYDNDFILRNGVVHPIDTVLIPPVVSTNNLAAELVIRDDMFTEFVYGLLLTNMTDIIEGGEFTIFAPTDAGFTQDIRKIFYRDMPNAAHYYKEMLRYHIVPGGKSSQLLQDGEILYTLHGTPIHITVISHDVFADGIRISVPDIGASNGVIHGIDGMLFPDDLRKELEQQQLNQG